VRDEHLRQACFLWLEVLRARWGDDIPYKGGLDEGFPYEGVRVPFLSPQKGIFRAKAQSGPAALSINTSSKSPYTDEETDLGFLYAYRAGNVDQPDNRALRAAYELAVPIVYYIATRPGWYRALSPAYVTHDDPSSRRVLVDPGRFVGPADEPAPVPIGDEVERKYAVRAAKVRLHQGRFRGLVLPAYRDRCAICRLKEIRLLDAAHITADSETAGAAAIQNGLSLCTIHHRAFDQQLVGVTPDYVVRVSPRLLDEQDGPMLDLLKQFHGESLTLPVRSVHRPAKDRLAERYAAFVAAS
jgi:putative restriction endonuclease